MLMMNPICSTHTHTAVCCRHTPPQIWCHDCVNTQTQGDHGWSVAPGSECVCVFVWTPTVSNQGAAAASVTRIAEWSPPSPFTPFLSTSSISRASLWASSSSSALHPSVFSSCQPFQQKEDYCIVNKKIGIVLWKMGLVCIIFKV